MAVQSRFNEEEGAPAVYQQERREPRTPPVDAHPADQRYRDDIFPTFIGFPTFEENMEFLFRII